MSVYFWIGNLRQCPLFDKLFVDGHWLGLAIFPQKPFNRQGVFGF
jgi:hypothetical protein